jgi:hypothetical protein
VRASSTWWCSVSVQGTRRYPASVSITARDRVRTGGSGALLQRLDSSAEGPAG